MGAICGQKGLVDWPVKQSYPDPGSQWCPSQSIQPAWLILGLSTSWPVIPSLWEKCLTTGKMPKCFRSLQGASIVASPATRGYKKTINFISVWARKDAQGNIRASRTSNWQRSQADSSWHLASQAEDRRRDILNTELAEKTLGWLS